MDDTRAMEPTELAASIQPNVTLNYSEEAHEPIPFFNVRYPIALSIRTPLSTHYAAALVKDKPDSWSMPLSRRLDSGGAEHLPGIQTEASRFDFTGKAELAAFLARSEAVGFPIQNARGLIMDAEKIEALAAPIAQYGKGRTPGAA